MKVSVIVAAGGQSTRFFQTTKVSGETLKNSSAIQSKLFFEIGKKPVLYYSLNIFQSFTEVTEIIVTVPKESKSTVQKWVKEQGWSKVKVVVGGSSRAESVLQGLKASTPKSDWVLVHDGARPLVSKDLIDKLLACKASDADAFIAARKVVSTIKKVGEGNRVLQTIDRSMLWEAETPQMLKRELLLKAYQSNAKSLDATDEASLVESIGGCVRVVESGCWNPKITSKQDLDLAQKFMTSTASLTYRTGLGQDLHRLVPSRKLILGGIHIPSDVGALGHSDGDALLHAISDAVLGVIGEGDIGDWFSDKNKKFKNLDSSKILKFVLEKAAQKGWRIDHIDSVLHLERPKLGSYKKEIKKNISRLAGLTEDQVSIKAKTREGLGDIGEGHAVAANVIVTMKRSEL